MERDFIVGFTLFTPKGFKTMYRHFSKLEMAKRFASNVNIKDNCKIYVDLDLYKDLEKQQDMIPKSKVREKIEKLEIECNKLKELNGCTNGKLIKILQELLQEGDDK